MIGYDPNALMIHMAHKQEVYDILLGNSAAETVTRLNALSEKVIREKTGVTVGCRARVCLSSGISLIGGLRPSHDHDDPHQHVEIEVTGINHWGEISYRDSTGKEGTTYMGMITLLD